MLVPVPVPILVPVPEPAPLPEPDGFVGALEKVIVVKVFL